MSSSSILAAALGGLLCAFTLQLSAQEPKTVEYSLWVRPALQATDVSDMVSKSDAVVHGVVVSQEVVVTHIGQREPADPKTIVTVRVSEPLMKAGLQVSKDSLIRLENPGGSYTKPDGTIVKVVARNVPELKTGGEYLFFLSWNQPTHAFVLTFLDDSVVAVEEGVARPLGKSAAVDVLKHQTLPQAIKYLSAKVAELKKG